MSTKLNGDVAEQAVILQALKRGWGVSIPVGDRLPYDLIIDVSGALSRVQVKLAWLCAKDRNFVVETRRSRTNRAEYQKAPYKASDFDFAIVLVPDDDEDIFFVIPAGFFCSYRSKISLVSKKEGEVRRPADEFRESWDLLSQACEAVT